MTPQPPTELKEKPICWVCKKEKKPYVVFMNSDVFSYLSYEQARENGEICERCDKYFAMTGDFKDATEEEFELAVQSVRFANQLKDFWEREVEISPDNDNKQDWSGTYYIQRWFRDKYKGKVKSEFNQGFLAGQQSSKQRILGIIDKEIETTKHFKEMKLKEKKFISKQRLLALSNKVLALEELKSLINSPQENKVGSATEGSAEFKDSSEPVEDGLPVPIRGVASSGSSNSTIYSGGCPEYYNKDNPKECGR